MIKKEDCEYRLSAFYKRHPDDQIWWVDAIGQVGPILFSFDQETIFNFWPDYPDNLTPEQKEIFDRENPYWAAFYRGEEYVEPGRTDIARIRIKGGPSYGLYDDLYNEEITINQNGIEYIFKPNCLKRHKSRKWSYRTDNPAFRKMWKKLCATIPDVLNQLPLHVDDGSEVTFIITYDDKTKEKKTFWSPYMKPVTDCFRIIGKMVPQSERMPEILGLPDN